MFLGGGLAWNNLVGTIPPELGNLFNLVISMLIAVYGLLLIASKMLMTDMARLRTYIRPLKLAYVDAGP